MIIDLKNPTIEKDLQNLFGMVNYLKTVITLKRISNNATTKITPEEKHTLMMD